MRLNQFEFLVALHKYKSFSKAAKVLLISQPSISRAIKELEEELGFIIINREKNGIEFTARGELLLEKASIIIDQISSISDISSEIEKDLNSEVCIGASSHICSLVVLDVLMNLKEKYPNKVIKLIKSDIKDIVNDVAEKELDIGIIQINTIDEGFYLEEIEKSLLTFVELFSEDMCFLVGQTHPLAHKTNVTMLEILQYPFVTGRKSSIKYILNFFKKYGFNKEVIQINDTGTLRKFLEMSHSISLISRSAASRSNNLFNDKLVALSISDFPLRCRMGWIHDKRVLTGFEEITIKEMTNHCRQYNRN